MKCVNSKRKNQKLYSNFLANPKKKWHHSRGLNFKIQQQQKTSGCMIIKLSLVSLIPSFFNTHYFLLFLLFFFSVPNFYPISCFFLILLHTVLCVTDCQILWIFVQKIHRYKYPPKLVTKSYFCWAAPVLHKNWCSGCPLLTFKPFFVVYINWSILSKDDIFLVYFEDETERVNDKYDQWSFKTVKHILFMFMSGFKIFWPLADVCQPPPSLKKNRSEYL